MDKKELKEYMADWYQRNNADAVWKEARNKQRAELRRNNKSKAVAHMGSKCFDCNNSFPDCCYDFHHKDSSSVNDVPSTVLHGSWKRILEEMEKCLMLCSNCHRIRHNLEGYSAHAKRVFK